MRPQRLDCDSRAPFSNRGGEPTTFVVVKPDRTWGAIILTGPNDSRPEEDWGIAEHWMARAEEALAAAHKIHTPEARAILIEIAEKYRQMAQRAAGHASDDGRS